MEDVKMESSLTPRSLWFKDRTYDMVVQWIYAPLKDVWKASPLPKPAASLWTAKFHWNLVLEFVCESFEKICAFLFYMLWVL